MEQDYIKDISHIKSMMQERSRFLSLSGLSGIMAGIYALIGAAIAQKMVSHAQSIAYNDLISKSLSPIVIKLLILSGVVLLLSVVTAYFFTRRRAMQRNEKMWSSASSKALKSYMIPLGTGGIFVILLIARGELLLVAPSTLIFYGLALYSASNYTLRDVGSLGIIEIIIGLMAVAFPGYGLYFWAAGFGILHILYGMMMYFKYDKTDK